MSNPLIYFYEVFGSNLQTRKMLLHLAKIKMKYHLNLWHFFKDSAIHWLFILLIFIQWSVLRRVKAFCLWRLNSQVNGNHENVTWSKRGNFFFTTRIWNKSPKNRKPMSYQWAMLAPQIMVSFPITMHHTRKHHLI